MAFKSKDVRRMASCLYCQKIGIHQPDGLPIPTLVRIYISPTPKTRPHHYVHPRCLVERGKIDALLMLPTEELGEVRMGDITRHQFKALLDEVKRRRNSAAKAVERLAEARR